MVLQNKLKDDFKEAFLAKDNVKSGVLKMLQAEIKNTEIAKKTKGEEPELSDDEVLAVINKEAKKRKDSIEAFDKAGREELRDSEKAELEILAAYLPEQMGEEEIRVLVKSAIKESGATSVQDMGKIMPILIPKTKGKADGNLVNKIVRELLG